MRSRLISIFVALYLITSLYSDEIKKNDVVFKFVPVVSSNPTAGTGFGVMGTMMYKTDEKSSPSQAIVAAQYTNTDSYNIFVVNKLFFDNDRWQSNTIYSHIFNNTSFSIDVDFPISIPSDYMNPEFEVKIDAALQQVLYLVRKNIYIGGQIFYISQDFKEKNSDGRVFLVTNGIESLSRGGFGLMLSYDTRDKDEKFYPTDSTLINLTINDFPSFLGSDSPFYNIMLNARKYIPLYFKDDVLAMQYFGQFCSEDTPDGALAAFGARNILRGFPIGKYKARYLNAVQFEYRYTIKNTKFRVAPFVGYANLSGGSKGTNEQFNRDRDNGDYGSGGVGVHYILSEQHQLDYRIDVAYSSDDEVSVYASINQAF